GKGRERGVGGASGEERGKTGRERIVGRSNPPQAPSSPNPSSTPFPSLLGAPSASLCLSVVSHLPSSSAASLSSAARSVGCEGGVGAARVKLRRRGSRAASSMKWRVK